MRELIRAAGAAVAFLTVVSGCAGGPLQSPNGSRSVVSVTSPSAAGSPTVGTSSVPSPATGWQRVTVQTGLAAPLTRVVWTGTQFLAVDRVDGTLLASPDGRTWQQQPRHGDNYVGQVAEGPQGLLAVGSVNAEGVVAIWHSTDGLTWTATPDAPSLHGRDGAFLTMAAIVPTNSGWLAVGAESLNCVPGACGLVRAVAWTSPNGLQWTRRPDTAGMQRAGMTGVVTTPSGYVAVGEAAADPSHVDSAIRPAVWTSADGRTWTRSDELPTVNVAKDAGVILDGVAVTGGRVVAVGHVETQGVSTPAFAWSSDGGTWSSVQIGRFIQSQDIRVVTVRDGLLAMFGFGSDATCSSAIWRSDDGSSWSCIGNDPAFADSAVSDAAVAPGVEVLVGSGADGAVAWTSVTR